MNSIGQKRPAVASSPVQSSSSQITYREQSRSQQYAQTTAAGIWLLATIATMTFWFWVCIGAISVIWEPEADPAFGGMTASADYLTGGRIISAFVIAIFLTAGTWWVARAMVDE